MEGIKYVNLIEIGPVFIEIRGVENGELAASVNNILVVMYDTYRYIEVLRYFENIAIQYSMLVYRYFY